jgi:hypothetical protein
MGGQIHRDHIEAGLRQASNPSFVEAYAKLILINLDSQVTVSGVVIFFQNEPASFYGWFGFQIVNIRSRVWLLCRLATSALNQSIHIVPAISTNDKRNVKIRTAESYCSRVSLVVVGMGGKKRMGVHSFLLANSINLAKHGGTAAMITACPAGLLGGRIAKRRMVNSHQNRPLVLLIFDSLELGRQEVQLVVWYAWPFFAFTRDHARVFARSDSRTASIYCELP